MHKTKKSKKSIKTSISLNEYYVNIIKKEIEKGKFSSASEVVREGLRLIAKSKY